MADSAPTMNTWGLLRTFFDSALIVVSLIGNGTVVFILLSDRRLRTSLNILLANLAAADLLVGAAVGPLSLISENGLVSGRALCVLLNCFLLGVAQASIFSLLALSIDRYLSLRAPFLYTDAGSLRRRLVSFALVLSWTLGFAIGSFPAIHLFFAPSRIHDCLSPSVAALSTSGPKTDAQLLTVPFVTANAESSAVLDSDFLELTGITALSGGAITNPLSETDNIHLANSARSGSPLPESLSSGSGAASLRALALGASLQPVARKLTAIVFPTSSSPNPTGSFTGSGIGSGSPLDMSRASGAHGHSESFQESLGVNASASSLAACSFEKVVDFRLLAFVHSLPGVLLPLVIIALIYLRVFSISQAHARSILSTLNFSMMNMDAVNVRVSKVSASYLGAGPGGALSTTGLGTRSGSGGAVAECTSPMSVVTTPAAVGSASTGTGTSPVNWNIVEFLHSQNSAAGSHEHISLKVSVTNGAAAGGGLGVGVNYMASCSTEDIDDRERARRRRRFARSFADQRKSARLVGLVIASMAICWLPLHTHNVLRALRGDPREGFPDPLYHTAIWLSHAHSAINPLIYALLHTGFRTALWSRLCGRRYNSNGDRTANRVGATYSKEAVLRCP